METTQLSAQPTTTLSTEDYWSQVQALREDLARLRPPGHAPLTGPRP